MQANRLRLAFPRPPADPLRVYAHDLRNLFAVVAAAKSLLERSPDELRKRTVLDALGRVAVEGKIVTDALLAGYSEGCTSKSDASVELQSIVAIVKTLERPGLGIALSIDESPTLIPMAPAEFHAVVLELVTNAVAADARRITIHGARHGSSYWLLVADDGSGFAEKLLRPALPATEGLHGTGMRRLASAAASAGGKVKIRSRRGRGSVVALILPVVEVAASASPMPDIQRRHAAMEARYG